jgi:hypothetical protein
LNSGPTPWVTPPALFCNGLFLRCGLVSYFSLGWLRTSIFLISASWVARITGMSHQCPVLFFLNYKIMVISYISEVCIKRQRVLFQIFSWPKITEYNFTGEKWIYYLVLFIN